MVCVCVYVYNLVICVQSQEDNVDIAIFSTSRIASGAF